MSSSDRTLLMISHSDTWTQFSTTTITKEKKGKKNQDRRFNENIYLVAASTIVLFIGNYIYFFIFQIYLFFSKSAVLSL